MLELKLIANLLLQGSLEKAKGKLQRSDFLDEKTWRVYEEMHRIEKSTGYFTPVLLDEKLKLGDAYFTHVEKYATILSDIPFLIQQMKGDTWKKQALDLFGLDRCDKCKAPIFETKKIKGLPAGELREKIIKFLQKYEIAPVGKFNISEALMEVLDYLEGKAEGEITPTSWRKLNEYIGGIIKGKFYIIGGKSSMGKTTMLYNIILSSLFQGRKCLLFQMEGRVRSALMRMFCTVGRVENNHVWQRNMDDEEFSRITDASMKIKELPITFCRYESPTLAQIREEIEIYEPDIVGLDYLQLMDLRGVPGEKKYQQLGFVGNEFARMAREYNVGFICLSQLSRGVDSRRPPLPIMSDIRESADLEHASDVVIFVNYPYKWRHLYEPWKDAGSHQLFFHVAKNRDGACSDWESLRFQPQFYFLEDEIE